MERVTTPERELSEDEKVELDRRIAIIAAHLNDTPVVTVEYFVPDTHKAGSSGSKVSRSRGSSDRWLPHRFKMHGVHKQTKTGNH